jgi:hypothetical protein
MAWWDFLKAIRQNDDEEKRRDTEGGFKNRATGFLDDVLDKTGDTAKWAGRTSRDVAQNAVGMGVGLARETFVKPVVAGIKTVEEWEQDNRREGYEGIIDQLKNVRPEDREEFIKNDPVLSRRFKDGKLQFKDVTSPFIFGDIRKEQKVTDEVDVKDNEALDRLAISLKDRDTGNDAGFKKDDYVGRQVFGNEPIKSYQARQEGLKNEAGWSGGAAFLGTLGNVALDSPVGVAGKAGKRGVSELAERLITADTAETAAKFLKDKVPDEVIERVAPLVAKNTDSKQIQNILDDAMGRKPGIPEPQKIVDELVDAAAPKVPEAPKAAPPKNATSFGPDADEVLGRMKTSEQIKEMSPKKSIRQKGYENFFNRNAPLDIFNKVYKAATGKSLSAADDPAKLAQLKNGHDDQVKQAVAPTIDKLSTLGKGQLDAVRVVGESQQILDRADKYAPEIVQRAQRAIDQVRTSLGDEQFARVTEGVQAMGDHHDQLLRMLVESGDLTEDAYATIKATNPNFFSKRNLVEYLVSGENRGAFSTRTNNVSRDKVLQAVKGLQDDSRYEILDPIESMVNTTRSVIDRVGSSRMFDAARNLSETAPDLVIPLRNAEDVLARQELAFQNKALRPVRNQIDRMITTRGKWVRRLESEIGKLEKAGLNKSLKAGGTPSMPDFNVAGLGGRVPTSQAGKNVVTTPGEKKMLETLGEEIPTNPNKIGPKDTKAFIQSLITKPNKEIAALKRQVLTREPKLAALFDEIDVMKRQYEDIAGEIRGNVDKAKELVDADVPKGYKAISRIRNGVTERIALPEDVANAWAGMNEAQRDTVGGVLRYMAMPLKAGATTLNLGFTFIRNPIRDARTTAFTSKAIPVGEYITVLPYLKRWSAGFIEALRDGPLAQEIRAAGGGGAGLNNAYNDSRNTVKELNRKVNGPEINSPQDLLKEAGRILGKVYGGIERAGRAVEYAPRLAEAKAVKQAGGTTEAAAIAARSVTVDFAQAGKTGKVLNDYFTFLNARLQGNLNVLRAIKENPKRATAVVTSQIAMPIVAGTVWNRTQFPDVYDQIGQDVKDNNFVLILGDEQDENGNFTQVLKIPKNEADKVFGNIAEATVNMLSGDPSKSVGQVAGESAASALPIDVMKDGKFNPSRAVGSTLSPVPKAAVENVTNKNLYFDSPIVSESMEDLPDDEQVRDNTAPAAKFLAGLTGSSPIKTEQALRTTTGTLLTKNPVESLTGAGAGASGREPANKFYQVKKDVDKSRASASKKINEAIAKNDYNEARKIAEEHNQYMVKTFKPWAKKYGKYITPDMEEAYTGLRINLSSRSVKQRRNSLQKATR